MKKIDEIRDRVLADQIVYLENEYEQIALKVIPKPESIEYRAKFRGGQEYDIKGSSQVVVEAWMQPKEITEQEYENY